MVHVFSAGFLIRHRPWSFICSVVLLAGWATGSFAAPVPITGSSWKTVLESSDRTLTYSFDIEGGYAAAGQVTEPLDAQFPQIPQWRDALREVLESWGAAADITFIEVEDSGDDEWAPGARGTIRISAYPIPVAAYAWANGPVPTGATEESLGSSGWGDMAFNTLYTPEWNTEMLMGVASHELGHALGIVSHNLNPESILYGLGGYHASAPSEQDLSDLRAVYFPQNAPAEILSEPVIDAERDWFAVPDGNAEAKTEVVVTGGGRILTNGEQKTGIKGLGISLAEENYGFDYTDLYVEEGGRIETDGHNAYGIGAGDYNTIEVEGFISTQGYSADGVALMGRANTLRTGTASLIRTDGDAGNGIYVGGEWDEDGNLQGNAVVANGRIETSGAGGCGIYAGGYSDLTLNGDIATSGTGAAGIGADQYGHMNIAVNRSASIDTRGEGASGILVRSDGNRITMGGAITTSGANAYGISTFWGEDTSIVSSGAITTSGETAFGIYAQGNAISVIADGAIHTSGANAYGIFAHGEDISVLSESEIATEGDAAHGLGGSGSGHRLENRGLITTQGFQAQGLAAANSENRLINDGTVTIFGNQARGLFVKGSGNTIANRGVVRTAGVSGYGIHISGSGNEAENSGKITTGGKFAHGMMAANGTNLLVHSDTIRTTGQDAYGIFLGDGNNGLEIAGDIVSRQAEAVRIGGSWNSDADKVEPTGATGNRLLLHGSPKIVGDMVNDGAEDGATVYFGIALEENAPAPIDFEYEGSFAGRSWRGEVVSGRVRLNGERNAFSLFTVHPGALLAGTTTLAGDLVNDGRVAPGNSIGAIAVEGTYLQGAGAILQMEIGGAANDRLVVGGDANFEDGALLQMEPTAPILGGHFSLLETGGTIGGLPQLNLADTALLDFTLSGAGEALILEVDRTAYADIAASGNQRQLGGSLDRLLPDASNDLAAVLMQIDSLEQVAAVRQIFDALTPTSYAAIPDAAFLSMRRFVSALPESAQTSAGEPWSGYARILSLHARRDAEQGIGGYRYDGEGVVIGADRRLGDLRVGGTLSYQRTEIDHDDSASRTDSDALLGSLRVGVQRGRWHLRGELGCGHQWDDSRREIRAPGIARQAESDAQADTLYTGLEGGYGFEAGSITLTPFAGLDYAAFFWGGFGERGAGALNVEVEETTAESLRGKLGMIFAAPADFGRFALDPRLRLAWSREFAEDSYAYRAKLEGESFRVSGRDLGRDLLEVGLELQAGLGEKFSAAVSLDYERRGQGEDSYAARGGITWYF